MNLKINSEYILRKKMNKWGFNNKDRYNEYMRLYMKEYNEDEKVKEKTRETKKEYYEKNKEERKRKSLELYYFYKNNPYEMEAKKFRKILI
jgi:hypothetical protein